MGRINPATGGGTGPRGERARQDGDAHDLDVEIDPALAAHLETIAEIDRELEAAIEYKLATGEEAVGEILQMVARVVERRRLDGGAND